VANCDRTSPVGHSLAGAPDLLLIVVFVSGIAGIIWRFKGGMSVGKDNLSEGLVWGLSEDDSRGLEG
jgi:hypothetical protein